MRMCSRHHLIHLNARQEAEKPLLHHLLNSRNRWQDGIPDVEVLRRSRADAVTLETLITSYIKLLYCIVLYVLKDMFRMRHEKGKIRKTKL